MRKLGKDDIVTIGVLAEKGESNSATARLLGVTEGAVRYQLRRARLGVEDGRKKEFLIERLGLEEAVSHWWDQQAACLPAGRSPNLRLLLEWLQTEHGYTGAYKSVYKYVRRRFAAALLRPFRRVETPPGAQTQTDWGEFHNVDIGDAEGPATLYAFVMILSHSRKAAVVWSRSMDQLAWHRCHNEAYRRLGGVAAVNRIDNLKTGISRGAGAWGDVNDRYRVYARTMGFYVDACTVRQPQQKGKTERRVGVLKSLDIAGRPYAGLAGLQAWTDTKLDATAAKQICPATGKTVAESWAAETPLLRPLPATLPEPFDVALSRPVHKDCTVRFEGREYVVPFTHVGQNVEIRGCSGTVQVFDPKTGSLLVSYPRHTAERILIEPRCFEGQSTDRVAAPTPLGKMGRKLAEIAALPVERRPIDLYAALAEVAR